MISNSRFKNSLKNSVVAIMSQIVRLVLQFMLRYFFILFLGVEYLSINGLFANILQVLSLTELGVGSALLIGLYKPIANHEIEKIKAFFNLYKKAYAVIAIIIGLIGLTLVPFLQVFVKGTEITCELRIVFILFLIDAVSSYFLAHYRAIFSVNQQNYINTINNTAFLVIQIILQILCIWIFKKFILYLLIKITSNFLSNISAALIARKKYPFLKEKCNNKLEKHEIKAVIKNVVGLFSQSVGFTILNSTDNIIISMFISTLMVGYYSNYSMVIMAISGTLGLIFSAVQTSIGNFCAVHTNIESKEQFLHINFIYFWMYSFCSVCLGVLLTPFVTLIYGRQFEMNQVTILLCVLNFYIANSRQSILSFAITTSLLWKLKWKPFIEIIINLVISIMLAKKIGINGVFIGTIIASVSTSIWIEPLIIYKNLFGRGLLKHYINYIFNFLKTILIYIITQGVCNLIIYNGLWGFTLKLIACLIVPNVLLILFSFKNESFKYTINLIKNNLTLKKSLKKYGNTNI